MLIYPDIPLDINHHYPRHNEFEIAEREEGKGKAVYTMKSHRRGELIAQFTGYVLPYYTQHTLQISPTTHLLDSHFIGFLAHSCSPNIFLDMQACEMWAVDDISVHSALTMDYASTEDVLFRQFPCLCGSSNCRHWVTGRKEKVNKEGEQYLVNLEGLRISA